MKNNIQIETLSQVHVGSGVFLHKDNDFIVVKESDGSNIYVIDPNKLGTIIGTDQVTIDNWVACVEKGNSEDFIRTRTTGHQPKDFALRRITNFADFANTNGTLKECLHDGFGRPYIPGSSIKGAIRSALVASLARKKGSGIVEKELKRVFQEIDRRRRDRQLSDFEKKFMGPNPNTDLFRFLIVGDALFEKGSEIAVKQINLNVRNTEKLKDFSKRQVVEAIAGEERSSFSLKIDKQRYETAIKANHKDMEGLPQFPSELDSIKALFALINEHTKQLVEKEIEVWEEIYADYIGQEDYISNMKEMLRSINTCTENSCVLRLGQAIGWRFITGAWTEDLDETLFCDKIIPLARPQNYKYKEYDFPKSRRIDDESFLFGFVKLTLKEL